jgi:hypothetical protein
MKMIARIVAICAAVLACTLPVAVNHISVSAQSSCGITQGSGGQIIQGGGCGGGSSTYITVTGVVPFGGQPAAAFGYNANANNEGDFYTLTNGGTSDPAFIWWSPSGSAFVNRMSLDNGGDLSLPGNYNLSTGGEGYNGPNAGQSIADDAASGGWTYKASAGSTNAHRFFEGSTLLWQMDANGNLDNAAGTVIPVGTTDTGTGNLVFSNAPALVNPTVGTQTTGNNSTLAASTGFVQAAITAISAGVTGINGTGGAWTCSGGSITCNTGTRTITVSVSGVADQVVTIPAQTSLAANTCTSVTQTTMTGLTSAMVVKTGYTGDPSTILGWNPASPALTMSEWPDSAGGQVDWRVCNNNSIAVPSASIVLRFMAQ